MNFLRNILNVFKLKKNYVSDADQFLESLKANSVDISLSKKIEAEKYNRIFYLRDNPVPPSVEEENNLEKFLAAKDEE